ncbi:zinc finger-containing ubiquitin peptidase 1-like [Paramacrobiotus metropolitanus]|uniref:zinc finger-containing ubiquitin peptidase 1-like n=1 Tax=Paramacrobiotus metropolitanus TaxID=2943436 RepID=UPI00244645AE|nr:zinc finger-containing ubiquitin peptidase 1-like [Paramacrobiotus metropolitanus]
MSSSDSIGVLRRYPTRNPNREQDIDASMRKELTDSLYKALIDPEQSDSENSMDWTSSDPRNPVDILRAIAPVLTDRILEGFTYDEKVPVGDGYASKFLASLQSLVDESKEAEYVINAVLEALTQWNKENSEYQKRDGLVLEHVRETVERAKEMPILLLCNYVEFYGKDLGDCGWGCGYRNAQMLISSLLKWPAVQSRLMEELGGNYIPSIRHLQFLIHQAWERGFDFFAATELEHNVVETSKWIGTTEIQALFHSMRIDCVIRDFGSVIGATDVQDQLFTFVQEYFATEATKGFVAPMYIQYSGHSRTIIGLEVTGCETDKKKPREKPKAKKDGDRAAADNCLYNTDKLGLLILDPGKTPAELAVRGASATRQWYKTNIFHPIKSFKEETYQILYFTGKILSDYEYELMKRPGEGHQSSRQGQQHSGPTPSSSSSRTEKHEMLNFRERNRSVEL